MVLRELLDLMQAGALEPEVAFLNASLIPDVFPLLCAANKTHITKSRESLTTHTLHSELVYNYSGSKHISESLKRCGISDSTSYILVARFGASADEMTAIKELIKGTEISLEELEAWADVDRFPSLSLSNVTMFFLYLLALQNNSTGAGDIFSTRCYNVQDCSTGCVVRTEEKIFKVLYPLCNLVPCYYFLIGFLLLNCGTMCFY